MQALREWQKTRRSSKGQSTLTRPASSRAGHKSSPAKSSPIRPATAPLAERRVELDRLIANTKQRVHELSTMGNTEDHSSDAAAIAAANESQTRTHTLAPADRLRRAIGQTVLGLRVSRAFKTAMPLPRRRWKAAIRAIIRSFGVLRALRGHEAAAPRPQLALVHEDPHEQDDPGRNAAPPMLSIQLSESSPLSIQPPESSPRLRLQAAGRTLRKQKSDDRASFGNTLLSTLEATVDQLPDLSLLQQTFQQELAKLAPEPVAFGEEPTECEEGVPGTRQSSRGADPARRPVPSPNPSALPKLKSVDALKIASKLSDARSKLMTATRVITAVDEMQRIARHTVSRPRFEPSSCARTHVHVLTAHVD